MEAHWALSVLSSRRKEARVSIRSGGEAAEEGRSAEEGSQAGSRASSEGCQWAAASFFADPPASTLRPLPPDTLVRCFSWLGGADLMRILIACARWRTSLTTDTEATRELWRHEVAQVMATARAWRMRRYAPLVKQYFPPAAGGFGAAPPAPPVKVSLGYCWLRMQKLYELRKRRTVYDLLNDDVAPAEPPRYHHQNHRNQHHRPCASLCAGAIEPTASGNPAASADRNCRRPSPAHSSSGGGGVDGEDLKESGVGSSSGRGAESAAGCGGRGEGAWLLGEGAAAGADQNCRRPSPAHSSSGSSSSSSSSGGVDAAYQKESVGLWVQADGGSARPPPPPRETRGGAVSSSDRVAEAAGCDSQGEDAWLLGEAGDRRAAGGWYHCLRVLLLDDFNTPRRRLRLQVLLVLAFYVQGAAIAAAVSAANDYPRAWWPLLLPTMVVSFFRLAATTVDVLLLLLSRCSAAALAVDRSLWHTRWVKISSHIAVNRVVLFVCVLLWCAFLALFELAVDGTQAPDASSLYPPFAVLCLLIVIIIATLFLDMYQQRSIYFTLDQGYDFIESEALREAETQLNETWRHLVAPKLYLFVCFLAFIILLVGKCGRWLIVSKLPFSVVFLPLYLFLIILRQLLSKLRAFDVFPHLWSVGCLITFFVLLAGDLDATQYLNTDVTVPSLVVPFAVVCIPFWLNLVGLGLRVLGIV
ncbi:hypothetical protein DIPPA_30667 [Diplonema papillatum]|nr:hypothetical protein DIPPA_30667 [Diplonema papillatum]